MVDNTNNTPQTFEQWLESKNDLTSEQRQALIDRNSQANVTFTVESFDRYLEELRAANRNQKPSSQEITPEQYKEAIELSKKDLTTLSYDEIAKIWNVVGQLDEKVAQATKAEAVQAKQKMSDFAEQLMSKVNPNQPWSMSVAPEVSEWLKVSNDTQSKTNNQDKKVRNAKIEESLNSFYQQFDTVYGLGNLKPEHAPILSANQQAISAISKDFEPFAKNDKGEYLHPEFTDVEKFYDKLEIDNSDKRSDALDKEKYKQDMAELAFNETVLALSMNSDFAKLSKEQQEQLLSQAWSSHMQAGMISVIAAQMAENAAKETGTAKKQEEYQQQAQAFITKAINGENNTFKVSNHVALSTLAVRTNTVEAVSKRIGQKTGHKSLWSKIKEFDKKLTQKYPKAYKFLKNLAISTSIGLTTGGAGLAVLAAYKTGKAIKQSYQHYKEANADGQYKSWFSYLRKNPKETIGLVTSVASTAMSVAIVGMDGFSLSDLGFVGQVYQNGLDNTWAMMRDTVSNAFSSPDAVKDQPWNERMSAWGKSFGEQVVKTTQDGNRMARLGISLTGGISSGAVDLIASFREKDPEKKKQLRKNAWNSMAGVFAGSLVSLGFSGFMKANANSVESTHPEIIHHDKPIGPKPYQPTDPNHDLVPEKPHHSPIENKPHIDIPRDKGPEMPSPQRPDLSSMAKPSEMPTHIDPIAQNHLPQTDNERALFEELRRGHNIGAEDETLANAAAIKDFNHYMELKEQGNFAEADKFLSTRHQQFENAEHEVSNQVSEHDSRKVAGVKANADKAYGEYKTALAELKNNPNSLEAHMNFDKAAMEMAKADVDKTEAVLKQEIRNLNEEANINEEKLEKLGLQRNAYEQEHGSLKSIEKDLVKLGLDPNKLPEDTSSLPPEAQELILHHKNLAQYQILEGQLKGKIGGIEQEITAHKDILQDLHSRHEETAGNAVNKHVAGYESYEGSRLKDLNEKIAGESGYQTQNSSSQNQPAASVQTEENKAQTEQTPVTPVQTEENTAQTEQTPTTPVQTEENKAQTEQTPTTPVSTEENKAQTEQTPTTPVSTEENKVQTEQTPVTPVQTEENKAQTEQTPTTPVQTEENKAQTEQTPTTSVQTEENVTSTTENTSEQLVDDPKIASEIDEIKNQFLKDNHMANVGETFMAADGSEKTKYYGNTGVLEVYDYAEGKIQARVYENSAVDGLSDIKYNRDGTKDVITIDIYGQKTVEHYDTSGHSTKVESPETNGTAKTPEEQLAYRTQKLEEYKQAGIISEEKQQYLQKVAQRTFATQSSPEGGAATAEQNTSSQELTETKKRLQEYGIKQQDDLSSIPQEQLHRVYDGGEYHISGDENSYKVSSNVRATKDDIQEFKAFLDKDVEKGTILLNGKEMSSGIEGNRELRNLAVHEKIYDDLVLRSSVGDTLSEAEQAYMQSHEETINKYGLSHDENGRIVKTSDLEKGNNHSRTNTSQGRDGRD